jgi:hypothetical protein
MNSKKIQLKEASFYIYEHARQEKGVKPLVKVRSRNALNAVKRWRSDTCPELLVGVLAEAFGA